MRVNQEGKWLIGVFKDEYEPAASLSDAQKAVTLYVKEKPFIPLT